MEESAMAETLYFKLVQEYLLAVSWSSLEFASLQNPCNQILKYFFQNSKELGSELFQSLLDDWIDLHGIWYYKREDACYSIAQYISTV